MMESENRPGFAIRDGAPNTGFRAWYYRISVHREASAGRWQRISYQGLGPDGTEGVV